MEPTGKLPVGEICNRQNTSLRESIPTADSILFRAASVDNADDNAFGNLAGGCQGFLQCP
jgi:hypothetical protein